MMPSDTLPAPPLKDALRAWRVARGFTQSQAADTLHVSCRTLQNWEHGRGCSFAPLLLAYMALRDERDGITARPKVRRPSWSRQSSHLDPSVI